jgi:Predicted membrane protein (DUF2142)
LNAEHQFSRKLWFDPSTVSSNQTLWSSLPAWKLYLLLIVPGTILLNLTFVNFHAPDDYDHLKRAYTLLHHPFQLVTPPGASTGTMIDSGLNDYIESQIPVAKFEQPLTPKHRRAYGANGRMQWSGTKAFSETPGSLTYFPALYLPQAIGLEAGRLSGASIEHSVLLARFANSAAGIALAAIGLYLLPAGVSLALLLLLLPGTQLQFASNSADPVLYGLSLIIIALSLRKRATEGRNAALIALGLFVAGTVRPPVATLALIPAVQALRERRWLALALVTGSCAAVAAWVLTIMPAITDLRSGNVGPMGPKLMTFALQWPYLLWHSFSGQAGLLYGGLIGHYAWGNAPVAYLGIPLPDWIYLSAPALFVFALRQDLIARASLPPLTRTSLAASAVISILLIFLAMYLGCTKPGAAVIMGMQGRYFVIPLFALGAAVAGLLVNTTTTKANGLFGKVLPVWVLLCTITMALQGPALYAGLL